MARQRIPLTFGPGLEKQTGSMVVQPGVLEDARNVYTQEGRLVTREGFGLRGQLSQDGVPTPSHILAGQALRAERIGVVVAWQEQNGDVTVWRVDPDGQSSQMLGVWFTSDGDEPPIVHMAEVYGRVFMAHDEPRVVDRASTMVYDTLFGPGPLYELEIDVTGEGDAPAKFRGVATHLDYLWGWGYGTPEEDRPELVRVSLPGQPSEFNPNHYFIVGDRRDPVLRCIRGASDLIAAKRGELHSIIGTSRANFGQVRREPLHGLLAPRLAVNVGGLVFFWSHDGPRVTDGASPSQWIGQQLDLEGFEPADLVEEGEYREAFATYIPGEQLVAFIFGRRAYVYALESQDRPWTYWELGMAPMCAFTLWDVTALDGDVIGAPDGTPEWYDTEPAGTYADLEVHHHGHDGDEILEFWGRVKGSNDEFELMKGVPASPGSEQTVRLDGLAEGVTYEGGFRYRRGTQVHDAYEDTSDPLGWPDESTGEFTTTIDPPTLGERDPFSGLYWASPGEGEWVWERTGPSDHYIQFRIFPGSMEKGHKIKVYRRDAYNDSESSAPEPVLLAELEEGVDFDLEDLDSDGGFVYKDENPPRFDPDEIFFVEGEESLATLWNWPHRYHAVTETEQQTSPASNFVTIWPGPLPQHHLAHVTMAPQAVHLSSDRKKVSANVEYIAVRWDEEAEVGAYHNWDGYNAVWFDVPRTTMGARAENEEMQATPEDQKPPGWGVVGENVRIQNVEFGNPVPDDQAMRVGSVYLVTRHGTRDMSMLFTATSTANL